jgi:hypothetical protein
MSFRWLLCLTGFSVRNKILWNISSKMASNIRLLLFKTDIGLPDTQCVPLTVMAINHNCTKAHNLSATLRYISYS